MLESSRNYKLLNHFTFSFFLFTNEITSICLKIGSKTVLSHGSALQSRHFYSPELCQFLKLFQSQSKHLKKEFFHFIKNIDLNQLPEKIDEVFFEIDNRHKESVCFIKEIYIIQFYSLFHHSCELYRGGNQLQ